MASISLTKVIEKFKWENLTPEIDISKISVIQPDINRPALQIAGYFEHFETTRLQIVGFVEYSYMNCMEEDRQREIFEKLLNNPIPGILFCRELLKATMARNCMRLSVTRPLALTGKLCSQTAPIPMGLTSQTH